MKRLRFLQFGLIGLLAGLALLFALWQISARTGRSTSSEAAGTYEGTALTDSASDFRLVDHNDATVALSDFLGQVVVLTFMDSQCQEICPLTAVHLRSANQALGSEASSVIFLGINVNSEANTVADVGAATQKWQLDEISTWHFLTGSPAELEPVWVAYNITVFPAPEADEELLHTPGVYLIDQSGRLRWYVSTPFDETGSAQWTAPLSDLLVKHIQELLRGG